MPTDRTLKEADGDKPSEKSTRLRSNTYLVIALVAVALFVVFSIPTEWMLGILIVLELWHLTWEDKGSPKGSKSLQNVYMVSRVVYVLVLPISVALTFIFPALRENIMAGFSITLAALVVMVIGLQFRFDKLRAILSNYLIIFLLLSLLIRQFNIGSTGNTKNFIMVGFVLVFLVIDLVQKKSRPDRV